MHEPWHSEDTFVSLATDTCLFDAMRAAQQKLRLLEHGIGKDCVRIDLNEPKP